MACDQDYWLHDVLDTAILLFNKSDDRSLLLGIESDQDMGSVGERAIAHRFAVHLERALRQHKSKARHLLSVDCEYNRNQGALKAMRVREDLKSVVQRARRKLKRDERDGCYSFSVNPDIIIHARGRCDANLIVVEMKRASSREDTQYDRLKLHLFTSPGPEDGYGYALGALILAIDTGEKESRELQVIARFIKGKELK